MRRFLLLCVILFSPSLAQAQIVRHPDGTLHAIHPAGGQRGTTVAVEFTSTQGLDNAKGVLIEGAPGVTVKDFKAVAVNKATATLVIAPDAEPGPRQVRVVGGAHGATTHRTFFVGTMPEVVEKEPNNAPDAAQLISLPAVVNGKIDPAIDIDCFSFDAKTGQRVVAAILAHGMDSRLRTRGNNGFLDTSLELMDSRGKVLASAEDTLGLDPVIEYVIPADGRYTVRVQATSYEGAPGAAYRLTLGDVPFPTTVFPAGARRGSSVEVAFTGFNVPAGTRKTFTASNSALPWHSIRPDLALADGRDIPFVTGEYPEVIETEPNDSREKANAIPFRFPSDGVTANGRFDKAGDSDWYRLSLKKGEGFVLEITAQRHLRSPVDTIVAVYDSAGKKLAENDDGAFFSGQCEHDYPSGDSRLEFTAPADGEYFVRVGDQSGVTGASAIYRLTVAPLAPGFRLHHWPDTVPVWGPGTSSCFVVQVQRWGGLKGDIALRIEGLPAGWKGGAGVAGQATYYDPRQGLNQKVLLTITAPPDAKVGDVAPFRVVGRAENDGKPIEHEAYPQTLLGSSHTDRMHLRYSLSARAALAPPLDSRLETTAKELTVKVGEKVTIPVKIVRTPGMTNPLAITVDGETPGVTTGWRTPLTLKDGENEIQIPLEITAERRPGTYGIVVSRSWAADLRAARPGPCTQLIIIHVKPGK